MEIVMGKIKNFFHEEIEHNDLRINYPEEYHDIHLDCEGDIFAYRQQLAHVKSYAPVIVKEHKEELINHMLELVHYLEDLG